MSPKTSTHCHRCGTPTAGDVRFCAACGQRLGVTDGSTGADDPLLARVRAALLNEYDVAHEIGRGGMAAVFLAEDLRLPRRVALKVMLPELAYSAVMPARFVAEARTAAMLDHPNIVPVFHAGEQDGLRYFAMRLIDGCSLEQLQRAHGGLPVSLACHILSEVASALAYAHAVGVVHRDVKPSNVMIDRRWGRAIVTDFGIARVADGQRLTSTGLAIGTPEYMSPEQYSNDHLTGASDQYALGAVAYQLLAGRPPFLGTQAEVLVAHLREAPPALRMLRPEVPMAVEALVSRMLAKDPADRWPSLAELATRFAAQVGTSPLTLHEQLMALVPERTPDAALPQTPVSPVPGVHQPDPLAIGGASLLVPAQPPASADRAMPYAAPPGVLAPLTPLAPVAPAAHAAPATPQPGPPAPDAVLASALEVTPGLKATGYAPRPVAPIASPPESPAPALQATGYTPRSITPIRPPAAVPTPASFAVAASDPAGIEETTGEHELVDGTEEYETPSGALEQHRAWLQPEPEAPVAPRRRTGLLVGGALAAATLAAVLLLTTRGGSDAAGPPGSQPADTATASVGVLPPTANAGDVAPTDPTAAPDSGAARRDSVPPPVTDPSAQRLVIVDAPQQPRRPVLLRDTLRLSARLVDGRRQAISHSGVVRWSSSAPNIVEVDQSGLLTARATRGQATITVRIDSSRVRLPVRIAAAAVASPEPPVARPPVALAALSADEAQRLVESVADAVRGRRVDALRALFAAGEGGPSPGRLLETIAKERELTLDLESRTFTSDAAHPTQRAGWKLSWKRGGLGSKIKGERDGKTADVLVRFEREGAGWRVQSLQLERDFRP